MQKSRTVLLTGAAGFIGSHVSEALLGQGERVIGIDNFDPFYHRRLKEANLQNFQSHPNFTFYEESLLNFDKVMEITAKHEVSHIVHLAAKAGVRPSIIHPLQYQEYNVRGTMVMLEVARRRGINNFLFASSSSVYGNNKKVPFSETDNVDFPVSPYAATKKAGELLCYTYHCLHGLNVFALRFFTVYGPRQRPEMAIHKFTRLIDKGESVPVYAYGTPRRDFTYIEDIVQGILQAINHVKGYEIINLGESQTITTNELLESIEAALGKKAIREDLPAQPGDVDQTFADISKARRLLNYHPHTPVAEGIGKFVEWYRENQTFLSDY
ncbi:MAG: GDP-mannose 4,6-dehydratase [Calditrichia bacterium]